MNKNKQKSSSKKLTLKIKAVATGYNPAVFIDASHTGLKSSPLN